MYIYIYMYIYVLFRIINIFICVIVNKSSFVVKKMGVWFWLFKFTLYFELISKCIMYELFFFMVVYRGEMFILFVIWTLVFWLMRYFIIFVFSCFMVICSGVWLIYCVVWLMKVFLFNNSLYILIWFVFVVYVRGVLLFRLWLFRFVYVWMWFFNLIFFVFLVCFC